MIGCAVELLRDALGLFTRVARQYGDIASIPLGPRVRILVTHPSYIEQILVVQQHKFNKGPVLQQVAKRLLGDGLLTSDGEHWRRQRRLAQPAFHRARLESYAAAMATATEQQTQSWRDGEVRNVAEEMRQLTLRVAVKTLFGLEMASEAKAVGDALGTIMRYDLRRYRSPLKLPRHWPTPAGRRAARAYAYLDTLVNRLIEEKRGDPRVQENGDLLSTLLGTMDEDGSRMTPKQIRDETMTLFIAGHETTAQATTWTCYLLSQNPHAEECLEEELARVLGGRPPAVADIERLRFTEAVLLESLRLYPPAYAMPRTSIEPVELGGYQFAADTAFIMPQWVVHRDARFFAEPEAFRPERWLAGLAERLPPYAYFPFGGGPRRCIGQGFALLEASLIVATLAQRYRFRLVPGHPVALEPLVTLRPKYGIKMTIHERQ